MSTTVKKGRPVITKEELTENWEKQIIEQFKDGWSIVEVATELGISKGTFYNLMDRDQVFLNAVKRGIDLSEAWWTKQGRVGLRERDFNYTGWYMNMKNRFKWRDRHENIPSDNQEKSLFPENAALEILKNHEPKGSSNSEPSKG